MEMMQTANTTTKVFTITSEAWSGFIGLLEVLKDDCTDIVVSNNIICQQNDLSSCIYYCDEVVEGVPDFSIILNNVKSLIPVFKIFTDEPVTITVEGLRRSITLKDSMSEVMLRYTTSLNNVIVKKETVTVEETPYEITLSVPTRVINRLKAISDNFQTMNFSFVMEGDDIVMQLQSVGKHRSSRLYKFGKALEQCPDFKKLFMTHKELSFSITPLLSFYRLISKSKTARKTTTGTPTEEGDYDFQGVDNVNMILYSPTNDLSRVNLYIEYSIAMNENSTPRTIKLVLRRVTQGILDGLHSSDMGWVSSDDDE